MGKKITVVGNPISTRELYGMILRVQEGLARGNSIDNLLAGETVKNLSKQPSDYNKSPYDKQ